MNNFVIISDSSCDLPQATAEQLGIEIVPLNFTLCGNEYVNYLDERDLPIKNFYEQLRNGEMSSTSAINVDAISSVIETQLKNGQDVLCLMFSSGLSTSCNSAQIAANDLSPKYPDRKILVVDSLCASMGEGLFLSLCTDKKNNGKSIDEVYKYAEDLKLKICHWFTVDDLKFLQRGGRIPAHTAFVGSILQIKPILNVSNDGKLVNISKTRGRIASIKALANKFFAEAVDPESQTVFISHGDCLDDVEKLKEFILEKYSTIKFNVSFVGPVIGSHSGPGTIAMFFVGKNR